MALPRETSCKNRAWTLPRFSSITEHSIARPARQAAAAAQNWPAARAGQLRSPHTFQLLTRVLSALHRSHPCTAKRFQDVRATGLNHEHSRFQRYRCAPREETPILFDARVTEGPNLRFLTARGPRCCAQAVSGPAQGSVTVPGDTNLRADRVATGPMPRIAAHELARQAILLSDCADY